jgi:hypothetical protein
MINSSFAFVVLEEPAHREIQTCCATFVQPKVTATSILEYSGNAAYSAYPCHLADAAEMVDRVKIICGADLDALSEESLFLTVEPAESRSSHISLVSVRPQVPTVILRRNLNRTGP